MYLIVSEILTKKQNKIPNVMGMKINKSWEKEIKKQDAVKFIEALMAYDEKKSNDVQRLWKKSVLIKKQNLD